MMAKSPRRRDISIKHAPERGGAAGSWISVQHLVRLERRWVSAPTKNPGLDPALALRRPGAQSAPQRQHDQPAFPRRGRREERLPPMVPRLRICGCAMCGSASWTSGRSRATAGSRSRPVAGQRADEHATRFTIGDPETSASGLMSISIAGWVSRKFIVGTRLWPRARKRASSQCLALSCQGLLDVRAAT